jgi:hypothetical protein
MDDEEHTAAGDPALAETVAKDPLAIAAIAADAAAWSDAVEVVEAPRKRRLVWAGLVALVCTMAAVLAVVVATMAWHPGQHTAALPPSSPSTAPPPGAPQPLLIPAQSDEMFWQRLAADRELPYTGANNTKATVTAHAICGDFDYTHPTWGIEVDSIENAFGRPAGWSPELMDKFIRVAVDAYCPQYAPKAAS